MNLYWGDLHNHCNITYGLGSLENALRAAEQRLDFCSVTPHAFWPDMPPRTPETDFLIDFHERGFDKIRRGWEDVKRRINATNRPGVFTTFFSYEIHSSRWGDHHFVSPDAAMALAPGATPAEALAACGVPAIAVPHHIGYTPGYRGIAWEGFDEVISPVVEVVSKHGCAMHARSGFPYYHDMGPLDPRNTVWQGLKVGKRFGFVGSTDHHAGFPGSYGDGLMGVWARNNTREALFEAIRNRTTYAVSGARIECAFFVNGAPMGAFIPRTDRYVLRYRVRAANAIDRVVIFKDGVPVHIVDGWTLSAQGRRVLLRTEVGWGDNSDVGYPWEVQLSVDGGRILRAEPCVRGRSVLSPNQRVTDSDDINRLRYRLDVAPQALAFDCETWRNPSTLQSSTAAVIAEVEGGDDAQLCWRINGRRIVKNLGQMRECGLSGQVRPWNSQAFKLHTAVPCGQYEAEGELTLPEDSARLYHMEARQFDGDAAYVSPVFIEE